MRILFISCLFPPYSIGGFELECQQVADEFAKRGHVVEVLTTEFPPDFKEKDKSSYPVIRNLKLILPFSQQALSALRFQRWLVGKHNYIQTKKAIAEFKPEKVFLWNQLRLTLGCARASMDSNIPIYWRFGDVYIMNAVPVPFKKNLKGIFRYVLDNYILGKNTIKGLDFRHTSCISTVTKRTILKAGVPIENSEVLMKGIPINKFPIKENLGHLSNPVKILYVGQLYKEKGVHVLLDAVKDLSSKTPLPLSLTIVGPGREEYILFLKQKSETQLFSTNYLGTVNYEKLSEIYCNHDIFVFPSTGMEGIASTIQEAMSSGLPCVSTSYGGTEDFLEDGVNSLIVRIENTSDITDSLLKIINDSNLRYTLAVNSRKTAERLFLMDHFIDKLEDFLSSK